MKAKKQAGESIAIMKLESEEVAFCVRGTTPLIYNAMSSKAMHDLLLPPRKNRAEREATLKHNPLEEYRASVYRHRGDDHPTRLMMLGSMFKRALSTAALDMPGASKSALGRLTWVTDSHIDLYGVPELYMCVVRNAGMNRTPDIRTRAVVPSWACVVRVRYAKPAIDGQSIINLMAAAGVIVGVGDFRQEKGAGTHGQFELVGNDDAEFKRIMKTGGRAVQDAALQSPGFYDQESEDLFRWFEQELTRRKGAGEAKDIVHGTKTPRGSAARKAAQGKRTGGNGVDHAQTN